MKHDVVIVGSGIVGMACAWAAKQKGRDVLVIEKDDQCVGASIRNFGFVTVTGQGRGLTWDRAKQTSEIWRKIVQEAGIDVMQSGLLVLAQSEEAVALLQELCRQPEGKDLAWLPRDELQREYPVLHSDGLLGALHSPHELRIESRLAIGQLKAWLEKQGVQFSTGVHASLSPNGQLIANQQAMEYASLVLAPGNDLRSFAPDLMQQYQVTSCRLSMLRVRPPLGYRLPAPIMSDLSLVRYRGYAELPSAKALLQRLQGIKKEHLAHGVHLIVTQSADGSLVVGDSHHYGNTTEPFAQARTEELILQEMQDVLGLPNYEVIERWVGYYPSGAQDALIHRISKSAHVVSVTSGTGMSTSFAIAQEWAKEI